MKDHEINQAIAESAGWIRREPDCWVHPQHGYLGGDNLGCCPDYCNDLNVMHEVENRMTDDEHLRFRNALWLLIIRTTQFPHHVSRNVHSATARQRAEAYLRTIGKWRGE